MFLFFTSHFPIETSSIPVEFSITFTHGKIMRITGTKFRSPFHKIITILLISIPGTACSFKKGILQTLSLQIQGNAITLIIERQSFKIIRTGLTLICSLFHFLGKPHAIHQRFTNLRNRRSETLKRIRNIRSSGNRDTGSTGGTTGRSANGSTDDSLGIETSGNSITDLRLKRIIIFITISLVLGNITALILYVSLIKGILIVHQLFLTLCGLFNLFLGPRERTNTTNQGTSTGH